MRIHKRRDSTGQAEIMMGRTTGTTGARAISQTGQVKISRISTSPIISAANKGIKVPGVVRTTIIRDMEIPFTTRDLVLINKELDQVSHTQSNRTDR
ncbi:hypothetical protein AAHA92_10217 [Salvia divinorum]|uniref:Uncharacterized protein n=1 Tax=Salvia divinorum TaxID=28513 RepID=A0ABD1HTX4_SALDI